ncbi:hypothetical protein ScPMuIL_015334 [Solemya velum]
MAKGDIKDDTDKYLSSSADLPLWADDVTLRPYQLSGVNWLIGRYYSGHGCILGDEMGLGKTCQTIAMIVYVSTQRKSCRPSLVICPRTLLENWKQEFKRFSPGVKTQCFVGEKDERNKLVQKIKSEQKQNKYNFDVLISTYELCMKDAAFLRSIQWHVLVVDEAHRLKNKESLLYRTLSEWNFEYKVFLTGTPVQNNLEELYSLLSFVAPKQFAAFQLEAFLEKYNNISEKAVSELHKLLQPYLLRRTKTEVLKDLPEKSEIVLYHGLSALQKKLYRAILTKDLEVFDTGYSGSAPTRLMNILIQLRKCVNHPYMFDGVEPEPFLLGEHLVEASDKLILIDRLLKHMKSTGHKVLLFSQMTHMLDIIQDYLGYRGYSYERLDGSVRGEERFLAVQNFNENEETFAFLLSTRAGGQGLNLVAADTVIFVDSDFNPQNDLQAAARAHRIGQTRPVKVIRLIGRNTVEEIVLRRAENKLKLTEKVIEEGQFSLEKSKQSLITDDKVKLQDILKFGVDNLLSEDQDEDKELDLFKILGKSVDGEWQPEEAEMNDVDDSEKGEEESSQNMYVFEGTDYSKEPSSADVKAFDELVAAEKTIMEEKVGDERTLRRRGFSLLGPLPPDIIRKPRKQLTQQEKDERMKKMKEKAAEKAKALEEQQMQKAQDQRKARYSQTCTNMRERMRRISLNLKEEEDNRTNEIFEVCDREMYTPVNNDRDHQHHLFVDAIVPYCLFSPDDSGRWGWGGLFSAIAARSPQPKELYERAGKMGDLALGDCHLISVDDIESREEGNDWLGLIIAQHRDKKKNLSGIKLSALDYGLQRVHHIAKEKRASVHLPRIGHDTPGFNWYGTERLIKKHLASQGIPTYIYYFPRKQQMKRKPTQRFSFEAKKQKKDEPVPIAGVKKTLSHTELPSIFSGICFYLHPKSVEDAKMKKYKRYIIAYPSHNILVVTRHSFKLHSEIEQLENDKGTAVLVSYKWLDNCISKGERLPVKDYTVSSTGKTQQPSQHTNTI